MQPSDKVYYVWGCGLMEGIRICTGIPVLNPKDGLRVTLPFGELFVEIEGTETTRIGSLDPEKVAESESNREFPLCQFYKTEEEAKVEYRRKLELGILATCEHLLQMKIELQELDA